MIETVRARLTLWYVSILAAALIVVAALIYVLLARALYARVDEAVVVGVQIAITSLANDLTEGQDYADAARSTARELSSTRQMVAIWYLNDVPGPGGETEFPLQEVLVRPAQGKLVLFPPFWTHVHRGVTLQAGVKYIATTWVCFA